MIYDLTVFGLLHWSPERRVVFDFCLFSCFFRPLTMKGETLIDSKGELRVSFSYQCNNTIGENYEIPNKYKIHPLIQETSSFSCLSGAALSANATLANTNICNGLIGAEILPSLDSPNSFRRIPSSPNISRLDILSSSLQSSFSCLSCSPPEDDLCLLNSMSAPSKNEGFFNASEVQVAGGAAGEDRVQAVCSEENGCLFCAIYDGFNGRDAADFLAGTLYETIIHYFNLMDWENGQDYARSSDEFDDGYNRRIESDTDANHIFRSSLSKNDTTKDSFRLEVLDSLQRALNQAENDFLYMVEQEMEDRPDLVSIGSCVLIVLIHGKDLYSLNLGDSRVVLATISEWSNNGRAKEKLKAVQLTESHTVDNEDERIRLHHDHPDDPTVIIGGKVKGKLKVTRAFGVGYLKKKKLNDALMGILKVRNLTSPPYVSAQPAMNVHRISNSDRFVIVASDGLFDFFTNEEAVELVHSYITINPSSDPAKFLLGQLILRAADCAGFTMEELMNIPAGRRRKYHDDVTVMVIILGTNQRTTRASTFM